VVNPNDILTTNAASADHPSCSPRESGRNEWKLTPNPWQHATAQKNRRPSPLAETDDNGLPIQEGTITYSQAKEMMETCNSEYDEQVARKHASNEGHGLSNQQIRSMGKVVRQVPIMFDEMVSICGVTMALCRRCSDAPLQCASKFWQQLSTRCRTEG
jgi:hypothetical protein